MALRLKTALSLESQLHGQNCQLCETGTCYGKFTSGKFTLPEYSCVLSVSRATDRLFKSHLYWIYLFMLFRYQSLSHALSVQERKYKVIFFLYTTFFNSRPVKSCLLQLFSQNLIQWKLPQPQEALFLTLSLKTQHYLPKPAPTGSRTEQAFDTAVHLDGKKLKLRAYQLLQPCLTHPNKPLLNNGLF